MRNRLVCMISTVAAVVLTASHASHADDQIDLATWDQSRAYAGILVTEFLDWSVHGPATRSARSRASMSTEAVR